MAGVNGGNKAVVRAPSNKGSGNANRDGIVVASANPIDQSNSKNQAPQNQQGNTNNSDPKKLKRIAASRQYSQRYRLKQAQYIKELEGKVRDLEAEMAVTKPKIEFTENKNLSLRLENDSLKLDLSDMSDELILKKAEHIELKKERNAMKQLSLMCRAPVPPQYAEAPLLPNDYNYNLMMSGGQPGFNQFASAGMAPPPPPPHQNFGNQFVPGPNNDGNNYNPM